LRTLTTTRSRASGFSKKSKAPSRVARTASDTVACPLIRITGSGGAPAARVEHRRPLTLEHHPQRASNIALVVDHEDRPVEALLLLLRLRHTGADPNPPRPRLAERARDRRE
jgi:hypothetical protein